MKWKKYLSNNGWGNFKTNEKHQAEIRKARENKQNKYPQKSASRNILLKLQKTKVKESWKKLNGLRRTKTLSIKE